MTKAKKPPAPSISELLQKQEPLHEDLVDYVQESSGTGWQVLYHPLIIEVPYTEEMNALYNQRYLYKKRAVEQARKDKDFGKYLGLHERPYRFEALLEIEHLIRRDSVYWRLVGEMWIDCENTHQLDCEQILGSPRKCNNAMMAPSDFSFLQKLPKEFRVYRGHQQLNQYGWSWTISYSKAKWFADRRASASRVGTVTSGIVRQRDVIAYMSGRGESEIVIDPDNVEEMLEYTPLERPEWTEAVRKDCIEKAPLAKNVRSDHGPAHWEKVERNAIGLAAATPGADELVCRLFAIIHDSQCESEAGDDLHGDRAVDAMMMRIESKQWDLRKYLTQEQITTLKIAIRDHNRGETTTDPTIGCCWDADRLDLMRVGIIPNKKLLSTEAGKELVWRI